MEISRFFNSIDGDRRYLAEDWAAYFGTLIGNGIFPVPAGALQVVPDGAHVAIVPGRAWINGYLYDNTLRRRLSVPIAHGSLRRIDRVVVRLDLVQRHITAAIKPGTPATNPTPPPLARDLDTWELALADVSVAAGATEITTPNILDQRMNTALCGLVMGLVQQIDPTSFFESYTAFLSDQIEQWTQTKAAHIDEWQTAKTARDTQTAAQLEYFQNLTGAQVAIIKAVIDELRLRHAAFETLSFTRINHNFDDISTKRGCSITTEFNTDGSITEAIRIIDTDTTLATRRTTFNADGSITEMIAFAPWQSDENQLTAQTLDFSITKRTIFNQDGTITEEIR